MRTARVHRHPAVAAVERELRSRLRFEAVEEALVDVDAVTCPRAGRRFWRLLDEAGAVLGAMG